MNNRWNLPEFEKSQYTHKSNAIFNIKNMRVIEVEDDVVRCTGGSIGLGHPQVYIKVATRHGNHATCKYCGLKFIKKH